MVKRSEEDSFCKRFEPSSTAHEVLSLRGDCNGGFTYHQPQERASVYVWAVLVNLQTVSSCRPSAVVGAPTILGSTVSLCSQQIRSRAESL